MVNLSTGRSGQRWFGIAWGDNSLVATAIGSSQDKALQNVASCVPRGISTHLYHQSAPFVDQTVAMLGELEDGNEENKHFTLSGYLSQPLRRILSTAAAIPIGYISTYGKIAECAASEARAVGRVMATNPLYPIVPCHRVVGADMAMVGYYGKQDAKALATKMDRLAAELRGYDDTQVIVVEDRPFAVYPTERVFEAAAEREHKAAEAHEAELAKAEADRMQLRLF